MTDDYVRTEDGLWLLNSGPLIGGCLPVMIANIGATEGFCEVIVYALNEDDTPADDVMVTTALPYKGEPVGMPNEAEWSESKKCVGALDFGERLVVWFTTVNGRDEPGRMRLQGLTV